MNNKERYKISFRLTTESSAGFAFLENYLYKNEKTDLAFIRTINLLLSYQVELLLKSRVVMLGAFLNEDELKKRLTSLSHNLIRIKKELGSNELLKIGIKEITKSDTLYIIKTVDNTEIKVEDFVDIRYDYLFGKMRTISGNEYKEITEYLKDLFKILKSVKKCNEEMVKPGE